MNIRLEECLREPKEKELCNILLSEIEQYLDNNSKIVVAAARRTGKTTALLTYALKKLQKNKDVLVVSNYNNTNRLQEQFMGMCNIRDIKFLNHQEHQICICDGGDLKFQSITQFVGLRLGSRYSYTLFDECAPEVFNDNYKVISTPNEMIYNIKNRKEQNIKAIVRMSDGQWRNND